MLPLIETVVGFAAIMLALSFLVKSLTSVVKIHFDYYSQNLKGEVEKLIAGTVGVAFDDNALMEERLPWVDETVWKRVGKEFLTKENIVWLLKELWIRDDALAKVEETLDARIEVHKANLQYAFTKKNTAVALLLGVVLCLSMNINAFTIWNTLYHDQDARALAASDGFAAAIITSGENIEKEIKAIAEKREKRDSTDAPVKKAERVQLEEEIAISVEKLEKWDDAIVGQLSELRTKGDFGVGCIWRETCMKAKTPEKSGVAGAAEWVPNDFLILLYEFFGSLLTGILISIGAPYWHDLLRAMANLRNPAPKPKPGDVDA